MIVRVPKRRNFVKEIIEDLPMINNKEDDHVMEEGDAVIRVELTNELTPSHIPDVGDTRLTRDTKSQCVNNADNHKRYDKKFLTLKKMQTNIFIYFTPTHKHTA